MNPPLKTHETSRKQRRRGWYEDPDPSFKDIRGKFEDATKHNGEIKIAAILPMIKRVKDNILNIPISALMTLQDPELMYQHAKAFPQLFKIDPELRPELITTLLGAASVPIGAGYGLYRGGKALLNPSTENNQTEAIKEAAIRHVLSKFALLDMIDDPIKEVTRVIKDDDFGYTKRKAQPLSNRGQPQHMRDENPMWGPRSGLSSGWVADRLGFNANENYGGV